MEITDYHAKLYAHELTRRCAAGEVDALAPVLADAQVDLNPHQVEAALFAFQNPLGKGAILADEVGLGKTIEAALLLAQKWAEGKRRLLIILPANLRKQWSQELADKFHLPTAILETKTFNQHVKDGNLNPLAQPAVVLCSFQFARTKAPYITQTGWDLVVVDEAHRLRNVYRPTNKIAQAIKEAIAPFPKVLLTATPLQNSLLELYGLVSILDDHTFGDLDSFRDRFVRPGDDDFSELKHRLQPLCKRTLRRQVLEYVRYTNRLALVQEFVPFPSEQDLYDKVSDYLQSERLYALPASQRHLVTLILRKLLASSTHAIASTLAGLVKKLEQAEREQSAVREIPDEVPENWEPTEELLDEWDGDDDTSDTPPRIYSAEELAELRQELQRLREFLQLAGSIDQNSKGEVLLQALRRGFTAAAEAQSREGGSLSQKAVIFTESRKTQDYLFRLLQATEFKDQVLLFNGTNSDPLSKQILLAWQQRHAGTDTITGSSSADMRAALVECFRDERKILIATEAAAEGINLQFCNLVVNYDLPWNPQRIEQRIGRCHRYGQKYDVVVVNFLNKQNAADQRVYQLLAQKFRLFDGVFGASDEVLGAIESGVDFEKRIAAIYQQCRSEAQIQHEFDQLQRELEQQIAAAQQDAREKLLDNFDQAVIERVKLESRLAIDRFQQRLWELTRHELRAVAAFDAADWSFTLRHNPFPAATIHAGPYRLGRHDADANTYRIGHALAQQVLQQAKNRSTPAVAIEFDYHGSKKKITAVERLEHTSGWLCCALLHAHSLDVEDHVLVAGVDDHMTVQDDECLRRLFDLPARVIGQERPGATISERLREAIYGSESALRRRQSDRNGRWFDAEVEKLDRWAADRHASLEAELTEIKGKLKDLRREAREAGSLPKKLELRQKARNLELRETEVWKAAELAKAEIDRQKDALLDGIAERLKQKTETIELFTIRWTVV
ncbi:MAG: DEAD/DEAH box helicase family protein [Planctomycetes bacterium]|nr:DEAD/DEAH box helicase family protein [Planctomycetota bacterium]